jgi:hypothetical protein
MSIFLLEKLDSGGRSLGVRINGKGYDVRLEIFSLWLPLTRHVRA